MSISEDVKQLYKTTNDSTVCKNYIMNIDGTDFDNKNIVLGTFSITEKLCSSSQLKYGECNASMLKVKVVADIGDISEKKIVLAQKINGNNIDIGIYNVDSCILTENKEYRDVVAYDNIFLFYRDVSTWYNELEFPVTMKNMLVSLCNYIGVELAEMSLITGNIEIEKTISPEELKGITVLKSIAELNAGFFRAAVDGKIEFVTLNTTAVDDYLEVKHYKTLKTENFATNKITRLTLRSEEDDIGASAGDGDNAYVIEDNFLLYGSSTERLKEIAEIIYETVKDISYIPYTAEQIGLPYLRCGSRVSYKLTNGENFEGLILQRTLSGTQGLKDVIKTTGTKTTDATFGIEKDVIKLKNKVNRLKRNIEQTLLAIEDLENGLSNEISQTASELKILVKKVADMGDMGVTEVVIMYAMSDSATEVPEDESEESSVWSEEAPEWVDGKYIWQKTVTTYNDGNVYESNAICITGATGAPGKNGIDGVDGNDGIDGKNGNDGKDGKGINSIVNYYLASASASGITTSTSGWTTTVQTITSTKKYLWNYEKVTYTDGTASDTEPIIIGAYGDTGTPGKDGEKGDTGDTGKGITSIEEYYLASSSASGVTTSTSGWTTTVQTTTTSEKYLWNYEKITYTDGSTSTTSVRIIGTHGAAGTDGLTIKNIVPQYYVSTSKTTLIGGTWSSTAPTWSKGYYVWTRSKITYSDNTYSYSTAICDASWEVANNIEAKLELKVDKESLISELNASADIIKLLANRLIIESSYFKLTEDGKAELAGGKIGDFEISDKLEVTISAYVSPGQKERDKINAYLTGSGTLTTNELKYFDLNNTGTVTIHDLLLIQKIILGTQDYSTCANAVKSTVTARIDPTNPNKLVYLSATTPWGVKKETWLGIAELFSPAVRANVVNGDVVQTTAGADLDTINSNLTTLKSESNDLRHLGTFTATTTAQTFTINNFSGYKTLVFIPYDGTLNLDSIFIPVSAFKSGLQVSLNAYALANYHGVVSVSRVSDTSIRCQIREITGWSSINFRVYGMI